MWRSGLRAKKLKTIQLRITTAKQGSDLCTAKVRSRGYVKESMKPGSRSGIEISNLRSVVLLKEDTSALESQNTRKV